MKQQIREATAFGVQPRILIHDNDGIYGQFGKDRRSHLGYRSHLDYWLKETIGIRGIPITPGCPQEMPHIERFNRTLREEALNHFVFFGEAHVHRVVSEYIRFFHGARPHQGLCGIPDPCSDLEFSGITEGSMLHGRSKQVGKSIGPMRTRNVLLDHTKLFHE